MDRQAEIDEKLRSNKEKAKQMATQSRAAGARNIVRNIDPFEREKRQQEKRA